MYNDIFNNVKEYYVLSEKPNFEFAKIYEYSHEPGDYFIINGQENVIIIHEQTLR